jgi:hypothetical protein
MLGRGIWNRRPVNGSSTMGRTQVLPATLMVIGPLASAAVVVTAVSAGTSAAARVIVNPYTVGPGCWPGGACAGRGETGETAAEVIVTGVPILL